MKTILGLFLTIFISVWIIGCSETPNPITGTNTQKDAVCDMVYPLIAGQHDTIGTLTVTNDQTNMYVTYTLTGTTCTEFGTLHLWIGSDLLLVPSNPQGIPVPGSFPYSFDASSLGTYTFTIPFSSLGITDINQACGALLYVVAHAEVCGETAFGGNNQGSGNRWWFYATYNICCDFGPPPVLSCKTAFAKFPKTSEYGTGYVFVGPGKSNPEGYAMLNMIKNRWGWAFYMPTIPTTGSFTCDIWAGAGLNDITKGTKVGTLTVEFSSGSFTVTYTLNAGVLVEEYHLLAEFDVAKPLSIAPGQFEFMQYFDPKTPGPITVTVPVTGTSVWLIAHAVACF
jgi:hypothetical protein